MNIFKNGINTIRNIRRSIISIHFNKKHPKIIIFGIVVFEFYEKNLKHRVLSIFGIKIKTKINRIIELSEQEKNIILNSGFWDSDWYIKKYHPNFNSKEAFEYWCREGFWCGESPSKYFNEEYINYCINFKCNPILYYLSENLPHFPNNCNPYKTDRDNERIRTYLDYKQTRKARGVVYTCITNDYDDIREIEIYGYIDKDWDYVCYTDNKNDIMQGQIGIWEIRPLQFNKLDNTRNNRWHKLNPHLLFPQYEESIYIDPNINILTNKIFKIIKERNLSFILPKHFKNICIYNEFKDVLYTNLDNTEIVNSELKLIKNSGMPKNYGFGENNLLYRKHNNPEIMEIDSLWWDMVTNYSKRDQLSLAYILWNHKINIESITIENTRHDIKNFYVYAHKKGRDQK